MNRELGNKNASRRFIGRRMRLNDKNRGHYLGTEIDEKWWRRYSMEGFLARGIGEFWIDSSALYFRRYLTDAPIVIALGDVLDIKVGKWHSGRWAGGVPVVKILWKKSDNRLSSGFVFSRDAGATETLIQEIRSHLQQTTNPAHKPIQPTL